MRTIRGVGISLMGIFWWLVVPCSSTCKSFEHWLIYHFLVLFGFISDLWSLFGIFGVYQWFMVTFWSFLGFIADLIIVIFWSCLGLSVIHGHLFGFVWFNLWSPFGLVWLTVLSPCASCCSVLFVFMFLSFFFFFFFFFLGGGVKYSYSSFLSFLVWGTWQAQFRLVLISVDTAAILVLIKINLTF